MLSCLSCYYLSPLPPFHYLLNFLLILLASLPFITLFLSSSPVSLSFLCVQFFRRKVLFQTLSSLPLLPHFHPSFLRLLFLPISPFYQAPPLILFFNFLIFPILPPPFTSVTLLIFLFLSSLSNPFHPALLTPSVSALTSPLPSSLIVIYSPMSSILFQVSSSSISFHYRFY